MMTFFFGIWDSGISALLIPPSAFYLTKMGSLCPPAVCFSLISCLWISTSSNVYFHLKTHFNRFCEGTRDVSSSVFNWMLLKEFSVLSLGESFCSALPVCQF